MASAVSECTSTHKKRRFVLKEHRSSVTFQNPGTKTIEEVSVDGCAILEGPRCDYLVNVPASDTSVFVELKGSDVLRAVEQLAATQEQLSAYSKTYIVWIVSSTRCPLTSTEVQNLALKIRKRMKATLLVRNTPVEYTV